MRTRSWPRRGRYLQGPPRDSRALCARAHVVTEGASTDAIWLHMAPTTYTSKSQEFHCAVLLCTVLSLG